jgi:hypothetical protein
MAVASVGETVCHGRRLRSSGSKPRRCEQIDEGRLTSAGVPVAGVPFQTMLMGVQLGG